MNWKTLLMVMSMGKTPVFLAPADDGGGAGDAGDNAPAPQDDDDPEDDDPEDDDPEDDDPEDDDGEGDGEDEDDDGDQDETGKGAEKRIRKLVEEKNGLKEEVEKLKKLAGDDGKAILAAAEATGILPGLMTKDEAKAFLDMQDIPGVIERYEDWLDDHDAEDELEIGKGETMSYGDVKKRVRKLRSALADLKETYGGRRRELSGKVREIFETGLAALKAGWKPDGKKTKAKKDKKKPPTDRPGSARKPTAKVGKRSKWGDVDDNDSFVRMIAAQKE